MPGFSRSSPPPNFTGLATDEVTAQIAALLQTLSIERATIYGCSSGGLFALALAATHPELVRNVIVHELAVPLQGAAGPFEGIFSPDDTTVVKTCEFLFRNVLNENPAAWDALGTEYHARLAKNYLTWARVYVASPHPWREFTSVELTQRPVTWTVGHPPAEALYAGNRKVADVAGIPIGFLPCRHFPQVSIPSELGAHIRAAATQHR